MRKLLMVAVIASLAGCSSQASRMADCEAQGVSKDTCYMAEQNRQTAINTAAEAQALQNASGALQYGQSAHKNQCKTLDELVKLEGFQGMNTDQMNTFNQCHKGAHVKFQTISPSDKYVDQSCHGELDSYTGKCITEQHAQAARAKTWKGYGVTITRHADGAVYVDGKPAALDEQEPSATVYSQGLNQVIFYKSGKVILMQNGSLVGVLK